ncbi:MAG: hypothetical protein AAFQ85_06620 [Pseudomonadota bacterium]
MSKDQDKDKGPAPEIVLTDGALRAASWREEGEYGPFYNTKITRRFTNADGDVRETTSLRERDLLPAAELASEAHRTIRERKRERSQDRSQASTRAYEQSQDWQDEDMSRKDLQRQRFKDDRKGRGTRQSKPRNPSEDY